MIIKAFKKKKDIKKFKSDYNSYYMATESLKNLIIPANERLCPGVNNYLEFLISNPKIKYFSEQLLQNTLNEHFGEHDFTFNDKKHIGVYLLNYQNLTFIVSDKIEVAIPDYAVNNFVGSIINFEKTLTNLCIAHYEKHPERYIELTPVYEALKYSGVVQDGSVFAI